MRGDFDDIVDLVRQALLLPPRDRPYSTLAGVIAEFQSVQITHVAQFDTTANPEHAMIAGSIYRRAMKKRRARITKRALRLQIGPSFTHRHGGPPVRKRRVDAGEQLVGRPLWSWGTS